ncbi:hypothetical protein D6745_01565 [Candidatus Woesearchaeota archaeon]|nr:MAG: hypothetical protein D6745_01565 [Candidatus Woesearchaeota archaeon]
MRLIQEGKAVVFVESSDNISKKLAVFYNPVMKLNRDLSIILLDSLTKNHLNVGLPLAGSGIRGIRFLKELPRRKIKSVSFNDYKEGFIEMMKKNLVENRLINDKRVLLFNQDANEFLMQSKGFDYIDIDPFGTPNPFLDSAVKRLSRNSILAVTATDTSALCGTHQKACVRKYWAKPLHNELKHEIGLRILIRKAQLVGAQYDKALVPVLSFSVDHYFRVFFSCTKGKEAADKILEQHGFFKDSGPMWLGNLGDKKLVSKMLKKADGKALKLLEIINEELRIGTVGFYDTHKLGKRIPVRDELIARIRRKGFKAGRTHFNPVGIKSDIPKEELLKII